MKTIYQRTSITIAEINSDGGSVITGNGFQQWIQQVKEFDDRPDVLDTLQDLVHRVYNKNRCRGFTKISGNVLKTFLDIHTSFLLRIRGTCRIHETNKKCKTFRTWIFNYGGWETLQG